MIKKLYYAVNGSGQGVVFVDPPYRDAKLKVWCGNMITFLSMAVMQMESEGLELPAIKWSDEPVELLMDIRVC